MILLFEDGQNDGFIFLLSFIKLIYSQAIMKVIKSRCVFYFVCFVYILSYQLIAEMLHKYKKILEIEVSFKKPI